MGFAHTYLNGMDTGYSAFHEPRGDKSTLDFSLSPPDMSIKRKPIGYFSWISCFQLAKERSAGTAVSLQLKIRSGSCPSYCTKEMCKPGAEERLSMYIEKYM